MSASPTSPGSSEVAADQPKDTDILNEPLSGPQPPSQDANHDDHPARSKSPEPRTASPAPASPSKSPSPASQESGEVSPTRSPEPAGGVAAESSAPPLPNEPPPAADDDGWDFHWDATHQAYFFYNRFTGESTWENPRLAKGASASTSQAQAQGQAVAVAVAAAEPPKNERLPAGGYNPAIHGDYDPNAWYAKGAEEEENSNKGGEQGGPSVVDAYAAIGSFNRFTGRWQGAEQNPERYNDEAKSRKQMNAFFDVDAAANSHDGRSLKAERAGKKPTKAELKQFKEKRRAKKEEKRRAWLRD